MGGGSRNRGLEGWGEKGGGRNRGLEGVVAEIGISVTEIGISVAEIGISVGGSRNRDFGYGESTSTQNFSKIKKNYGQSVGRDRTRPLKG